MNRRRVRVLQDGAYRSAESGSPAGIYSCDAYPAPGTGASLLLTPPHPARARMDWARRHLWQASGSHRWQAHRLDRGAPTGLSSFLGRFRAGGGTYPLSLRAAIGPFTT